MIPKRVVVAVLERDSVCVIGDCSRSVLARGWCGAHWQKWRKYGDPLGEAVRATLADRFWSKVNRTDSCWLWTSALDNAGYGVFSIGNSKTERAHRLTWEWANGRRPLDGMHLDHLCRVTACCNPDHLEEVTPRENSVRGEGRAGTYSRTNTCERGHSMKDAYVRPDTGARMCRECSSIRKSRSRGNS
jgi:hypothetical protein